MAKGYLLIVLSGTLTSIMVAVRKKYELSVNATVVKSLFYMLVSSVLVCAIGLIYSLFTDFYLFKNLDLFVIVVSIVFSIILTVNTSLCIFAAKYGSLAVASIFATLGTLVISTIYGLISNPERNHLNVFNIVAFALVFTIIILSFIDKRNKNQNEVEHKNKKIFSILCILIFLFNGSALSVYSLFTTKRPEYGSINFIFVYLFFSVILSLIVISIFIIFKRKYLDEIRECIGYKPILNSCLYGLIFMLAEFCALLNTSILPITIQAPLSFAFSVILIAFVDYFIYKQKLNPIQIIEIILALISGVLFAI